MEAEATYRESMNKAIKLLAAREHSVAEMREKLLTKRRNGGSGRRGLKREKSDCASTEEPPNRRAIVDSVIESLIDDGLLSDERFAESFVRAKTARGNGPIKIRADLRQRGVDDQFADQFLTREDSYWLDLAGRAQAKKFGALEPENRADWGRRARFLAGRGFPSDLIYRLLGPQHH